MYLVCGPRLQVYLATHPDDVEGAKAAVGEAAEIVPMVNGDSWMRDSGPTFVKNRQTGEVINGAVGAGRGAVCYYSVEAFIC
jgi:agmatine/peptidylarginine deiminase